MSGESFRFIHASDFHLEKPLGDLDEFPPALRESLTFAAFEAMSEVFDAAMSANIDFVVLTGDLLHPLAAGPYGMSQLLEQLERLNEAGKPVYWATGRADAAENWPEAMSFPENVKRFPVDHGASVHVERGSRVLCRLVGRSADGRASLHVPSFECETTDEFTIGIGYGDADQNSLAEAKFDLWCLGKKHNRQVFEHEDEVVALYCGSPQGRGLDETGLHGYSIVDVDSDRKIRVQEVAADRFRYLTAVVKSDEIAQFGSIQNVLGERVIRMQHDAGGRNLIIMWEIVAEDAESLTTIGDADKLLAWLRREYGHGTPAAWSTALTIRPPKKYPKTWHEEETILGDYLQIAAEQRSADAEAINLLPVTEEHSSLSASTTTLLAEVPPTRRSETLDQATLLGVELLRGGKPNWVHES